MLFFSTSSSISGTNPILRATATAFRKHKKLQISSFEAQGWWQLLRFVPMLRYILTLRFRDAAAPGVRKSISCKENKVFPHSV